MMNDECYDEDDDDDGSIDWADVGSSLAHLTFALLRGSSSYLVIGMLSNKS